jgi:hypothetical protein
VTQIVKSVWDECEGRSSLIEKVLKKVWGGGGGVGQ